MAEGAGNVESPPAVEAEEPRDCAVEEPDPIEPVGNSLPPKAVEDDTVEAPPFSEELEPDGE